jgi:predicted RNase H-like nuclease (RuvC/YqgF family)
MKFGEIKTDNGTLIFEGELVEGLDVFVENEGELVIAPDGEYKTEDGKTITVVSGKIETIIEPETEPIDEVEPIVEEQPIENEEVEPTVENPTNDESETDTEAIVEIRKEIDELYKRINELEEIIKGKDAEIEKLNSHIEQFSKPAIEEVEVVTNKENKFSKYFKK